MQAAVAHITENCAFTQSGGDSLSRAEILLNHGADATAYVPGSKYGNALTAVNDIYKHDEVTYARFMKLLGLEGEKEISSD